MKWYERNGTLVYTGTAELEYLRILFDSVYFPLIGFPMEIWEYHGTNALDMVGYVVVIEGDDYYYYHNNGANAVIGTKVKSSDIVDKLLMSIKYKEVME